MQVQRIAAFSDGDRGGNPAGVVICATLPGEADMKDVARQVGYSETVFAAPMATRWRARYFSPDAEIPFCGHATIALGVALAQRHGAATFELEINAGSIPVQGFQSGASWGASLRSPQTWSKPVAADELHAAIAGLGLDREDVDWNIPPARIHAGADHLFLMLRDRAKLAAMRYDFEPFQTLMRRNGWVTVALCFAESPSLLYARNAFAYGGVYEDPATGAAAAAMGAYLRDLGWPTLDLEIRQGDDMGVPCRIFVCGEPGKGAPARVSGSARPCGA